MSGNYIKKYFEPLVGKLNDCCDFTSNGFCTDCKLLKKCVNAFDELCVDTFTEKNKLFLVQRLAKVNKIIQQKKKHQALYTTHEHHQTLSS